MTNWYAPNQQAVGTAPAVPGVEPQKKAAAEPTVEEEKPKAKKASSS